MTRRSLRSVFVAISVAIVICIWGAKAATASIINLVDESKQYDVLRVADVLDDPTGNLEIGDVSQSVLFVSSSSASQPTDDGVRWYKFRAAMPPESRWYLLTSAYCSDADLYAPTRNGRFEHHAFGYRVPFDRHPTPDGATGVAVDGLSGSVSYVRLRCERDVQVLFFKSSVVLAPVNFIAYTFTIVSEAFALLAFGFAIVARTRLFALIGLTAATAASTYPLTFIAALLPTISPIPYYITAAVPSYAFFVCQLIFFETFLGRTRARWTSYLVRAELGIVLALSIWPQFFSPIALRTSLPYVLLFDLVQALYYGTVIVILVAAAKGGNRSAWFVVTGTTLYLVCMALSDLAVERLVPSGSTYAISGAVSADTLIFLLGVGDRLRETGLAFQRALQEKQAVQSEVLNRQLEHIADIERLNSSFERFVPRDFLQQLARSDITEVELGDHVEREMAILFTDIRGFTQIAERLSAADTFEFLNAYLAQMGPIVRSHRGFIDKYVGDAIVALFVGLASDALDAAIALQGEVRRFNETRARVGEEIIAVGVGVHFGAVTLGTIGEARRLETTVIADAVNVASRLEGLTKVYGASIIASAAIVEALPDRSRYGLRPLGNLSLRGHHRPERAFEVIDGDTAALLLQKRRTTAQFEASIAAYEGGDYARSYAVFDEIASANPLDGPALYLRDRSAALRNARKAGG